jgi:hypothetical protein
MAPSTDVLSSFVADVAAHLGARLDDDDGVSTYLEGEVVVAVVTRTSVEFRLRPDVATAAARTVDAAPSARGPEWVTFTPTSFDRFTRDRIEAWFEFAVRQARASASVDLGLERPDPER